MGSSNIIHYSKNIYSGGTQNWSIAQDQKGIMYVANNNGLLIYDGVRWQLERMPNYSVVRSVFTDKSGKIYVGASNELGKVTTSRNGKRTFQSLKQFIPVECQNFDDIWSITTLDDQVVFQSYNFAFFFRNDSVVTVLKAPARFQNSFKVKNQLYFNDLEKGILEFQSGKLIPLKGFESLIGEEIAAVLPYGNSSDLMILTLHKGIFLFDGIRLTSWNVAVNQEIKKNQIYSAIVLQDDYIAIGTVQNGLYILDKNGAIVQHVNRLSGLQNSTVLNLFSDRDSNLWIALDNGIDLLNTNSSISFIQHSDRIGSGYASIIHKNKIYLGTNQGLFVKTWKNSDINDDFRMIPGTNGQVWYLGMHDGNLICGHNNGTYLIEDEKAVQISRVQGAWKFHQLKRFPDYLIGGTYSGLTYFKKQNGKWVFVDKIEGFNQSFRVFEEDQYGDIWMSHDYHGIYRIQFGNSPAEIKNVSYFNSTNGLPSDYNLYVYKIRNRIVVASNSGIYEFDAATKSFVPSGYFSQLFGPTNGITYLTEDAEGNVWYVTDNQNKNSCGVFRIQEDMTYQNLSSPFYLLAGKFVTNFEFIYPYTAEHVLFGTDDGFAHYSPQNRLIPEKELHVYINQAQALYLDSAFYFGQSDFAGSETFSAEFVFPFKDNSFRFSYSAPSYYNQSAIEYSYQLAGYSDKWSAWSTTSFNEFSQLPEGDYVFKVKARNHLGIESEIDEIWFTVSPPWYRTIYAYSVYLLLFMSLILGSVWFVLHRIEISKRKERLKHLQQFRQKELDFKSQALLSEKKIIELKNDKLRIEMVHRDKELANQTMLLIQKNKFLTRLKEDLEKLRNSSSDEHVKNRIVSLIGKINKDIDQKNQWEVFETAFDEVHEDFLTRLKNLYPNLTPKELKLCAYLRMNISTKEIAPLMNISIRGVEILRYRLRKKLNIDRDQNLTSMIIDL